MEMFSKQGVSVPITTTMEWEAYQHVLECMPRLLTANIILKSWMNREVHVQFCEEQGVKSPLLTRLYVRPLS